MEAPVKSTELKKSCINCGAEMKYQPGTKNISCEYCGHEESIRLDENGFEELELYPYLQEMGAQKHGEEISMLQCKNCGATQHIEENYKSLHCVYCSMPSGFGRSVQGRMDSTRSSIALSDRSKGVSSNI